MAFPTAVNDQITDVVAEQEDTPNAEDSAYDDTSAAPEQDDEKQD